MSKSLIASIDDDVSDLDNASHRSRSVSNIKLLRKNEMALTIGELVKWTKDQILNVQDNVENRKLDFGKEGYLKG